MRSAALLFLLAGCATVVPMQTASALSDGTWRLGGQLSTAAYCGIAGGPFECSEFPDGISMPELRLDARRGIPGGSDVGISVQLATQVLAPERPVQLGLALEAKHELVSTERHVLSIDLLGAAAIAGRPSLAALGQGEWAITLLYGLRLARFEVVTGASLSQRIPTRGFVTERIGFTVGLFRRAPSGWALQLGYAGQPSRFGTGSLQVQYGIFWDFPGA